MSVQKERKEVVVAEIREKLIKAKSVVLVNYSGINVEQATKLRKGFREAGLDYKVYKNKLVEVAAKDTVYEALVKDLNGPNAFAISYTDAVAPAKLIRDYAKEFKKMELRSGVVEGVYYSADQVAELANLPSKEVLIGRFLGSIKSPISNFAYLLQAIIDKQEATA